MGLKERSPLHRILRCYKHISLDKLKVPFIYIENEKGGHCPYGWNEINEEYKEWDCIKFFTDYGKKSINALKEQYNKSINRSVEVFNKRLKILYERNLMDDTLIMFLSDHGEMLGDYGGLVGHTLVTVPELIYVPIILIHPDLPERLTFENIGVLRHVDIFPTICDIIKYNINNISIDGCNIFKLKEIPEYGYSYYYEYNRNKKGIKKYFNYVIKEIGIWNKNGGYVFREGSSLLSYLIRALYLTLFSKEHITSIYKKQCIKRKPVFETIKNYYCMIKLLCNSINQFENIQLDINEAKKIIKGKFLLA
ncbi:MAG: sulfatase-like hydrolase/transferase [Candidatus Hodarchaeota archaeon]